MNSQTVLIYILLIFTFICVCLGDGRGNGSNGNGKSSGNSGRNDRAVKSSEGERGNRRNDGKGTGNVWANTVSREDDKGEKSEDDEERDQEEKRDAKQEGKQPRNDNRKEGKGNGKNEGQKKENDKKEEPAKTPLTKEQTGGSEKKGFKGIGDIPRVLNNAAKGALGNLGDETLKSTKTSSRAPLKTPAPPKNVSPAPAPAPLSPNAQKQSSGPPPVAPESNEAPLPIPIVQNSMPPSQSNTSVSNPPQSAFNDPAAGTIQFQLYMETMKKFDVDLKNSSYETRNAGDLRSCLDLCRSLNNSCFAMKFENSSRSCHLLNNASRLAVNDCNNPEGCGVCLRLKPESPSSTLAATTTTANTIISTSAIATSTTTSVATTTTITSTTPLFTTSSTPEPSSTTSISRAPSLTVIIVPSPSATPNPAPKSDKFQVIGNKDIGDREQLSKLHESKSLEDCMAFCEQENCSAFVFKGPDQCWHTKEEAILFVSSPFCPGTENLCQAYRSNALIYSIA